MHIDERIRSVNQVTNLRVTRGQGICHGIDNGVQCRVAICGNRVERFEQILQVLPTVDLLHIVGCLFPNYLVVIFDLSYLKTMLLLHILTKNMMLCDMVSDE